jgi:hypothetical protein
MAKADDVHQAVPADRHRPELDGDRVDIRVGNHGGVVYQPRKSAKVILGTQRRMAMKPPEQVLRVAVLAVPESTASTLYGMCDLLASAGRDWAALIEGRQAQSAIHAFVVSADGRRMELSNGLAVEPAFSLLDCPRPDVVAIPDLAVLPGADLSALLICSAMRPRGRTRP